MRTERSAPRPVPLVRTDQLEEAASPAGRMEWQDICQDEEGFWRHTPSVIPARLVGGEGAPPTVGDSEAREGGELPPESAPLHPLPDSLAKDYDDDAGGDPAAAGPVLRTDQIALASHSTSRSSSPALDIARPEDHVDKYATLLAADPIDLGIYYMKTARAHAINQSWW